MEHILKIKPEYFNYIKDGTKRIELRLYDEKRQKINIGDIIIFKKESELNEIIRVEVVNLLRYDSFQELINELDIELIADKKMSKLELLKVLDEIYSKEKQEKYGVLGICIKII